MSPRFRAIAVALFLATYLSVATCQQFARAEETQWIKVALPFGAIAVPQGWRDFDKMSPRIPFYRQGRFVLLVDNP